MEVKLPAVHLTTLTKKLATHSIDFGEVPVKSEASLDEPNLLFEWIHSGGLVDSIRYYTL